MGYIYTKPLPKVAGHRIRKRSKKKVPYYRCECGWELWPCGTEPAYQKDPAGDVEIDGEMYREIVIHKFDNRQIAGHIREQLWK